MCMAVAGLVVGLVIRDGDGGSDNRQATANVDRPITPFPTELSTEVPTRAPSTTTPTQRPTSSTSLPTSIPTQAPTFSPTSSPTTPLCSYCPVRPMAALEDCSTKSTRASCAGIVTSQSKYGVQVQGVDLRCYTGGVLEWIGCSGVDNLNCAPETFSCTDGEERLEFGTSSSRYLAMVFDPENCCPVDSDPGRFINFCSSGYSNPTAIMNVPSTPESVTALCQALGYNYGSVVTGALTTGCPTVLHGGDGPADWIYTARRSPRALVYTCTMSPPTENPTLAPSPSPTTALNTTAPTLNPTNDVFRLNTTTPPAPTLSPTNGTSFSALP